MYVRGVIRISTVKTRIAIGWCGLNSANVRIHRIWQGSPFRRSDIGSSFLRALICMNICMLSELISASISEHQYGRGNAVGARGAITPMTNWRLWRILLIFSVATRWNYFAYVVIRHRILHKSWNSSEPPVRHGCCRASTWGLVLAQPYIICRYNLSWSWGIYCSNTLAWHFQAVGVVGGIRDTSEVAFSKPQWSILDSGSYVYALYGMWCCIHSHCTADITLNES